MKSQTKNFAEKIAAAVDRGSKGQPREGSPKEEASESTKQEADEMTTEHCPNCQHPLKTFKKVKL